MDIHVLWISVFNYPCFYGYPCIDLLWILDPGNVLPGGKLAQIKFEQYDQYIVEIPLVNFYRK